MNKKDNGSAVKGTHMRIRIRSGAEASISIIDVLGNSSESSATRVLLHDLGPYGMQFQTHLRFPVSNDYAIRAIITLGDWQFSVIGNVKWRRVEENQYVYGCEFIPDRRLSLAIIHALGEKLREMSPRQLRIHALYRRMSEQIKEVGHHLDMKR
ncbi:hypothetical protein PAECIP111893_03317 [Paenibacillus plantiphilus]|uniref:PilZ domain-containing protein n=1 Tax=Paenibacillus plantiphilus TaxID=2905650 RepID=A0ABN8GPM9_9BACL|nr:hypothetical protein [Paenibacillus plantiphilus]CAH1210887.1 hypothetical protein PAECIP111893_03317 [Paenibacillus plantiphilus]